MKISVVITVFNDPRIKNAIESILSQKCSSEVEIIIIDAGSTDATLAVVENYRPHLAKVVSESDRGIFDGLNKGIKLATGDVVALLGADDKFDNSQVFAQVETALQDTAVEGCYANLVYVDDDDNIVRYWRSGKCSPLKFYFGWSLPHFTFFARREVYDKYGLLDINYKVAADYEYFLRLLLKHRVKLKYVDAVFVRMTLGGTSNGQLRNILRGNRDASLAWKNNNIPFGYLAPLLKPMRKIPQYWARPSEPK